MCTPPTTLSLPMSPQTKHWWGHRAREVLVRVSVKLGADGCMGNGRGVVVEWGRREPDGRLAIRLYTLSSDHGCEMVGAGGGPPLSCAHLVLLLRALVAQVAVERLEGLGRQAQARLCVPAAASRPIGTCQGRMTRLSAGGRRWVVGGTWWKDRLHGPSQSTRRSFSSSRSSWSHSPQICDTP